MNYSRPQTQAYQKKFELMVAIGGGSVMDAAKFISVSNKSQGYEFVENLAKGKIPKKDYKINLKVKEIQKNQLKG